jgi:hypothetical protein
LKRFMERRPSPAMVVAFVALLAALSGTAVALPGKSTVDSGDLKNRNVKNADIATGANNSRTTRNDSLTGTDINESTLGKVPSAANADSATNATNATKAQDSGTLDGLDSSAFALAGHDHDSRYYTQSQVNSFLSAMRLPETGNGVGNNFGCPGTELGVRIANGLGEFVDHRFTFQVQGSSAQAWGQIRSDGSIRSSSSNVSGVTHTAGTGVYCIQFSASAGDLEGAVVTPHLN